MELESKQMTNDLNEPFEIVYNARKNSKQIKIIQNKERKNSTFSLVDEKHKIIKKKPRKLTQSLDVGRNLVSEFRQLSEKRAEPLDNGNWQSFMQFDQNVSKKQSIKKEEEGMAFQGQQFEGFSFQDHQGEKCILEGIGDENSLGRQFNFDFFNPEKFSG